MQQQCPRKLHIGNGGNSVKESLLVLTQLVFNELRMSQGCPQDFDAAFSRLCLQPSSPHLCPLHCKLGSLKEIASFRSDTCPVPDPHNAFSMVWTTPTLPGQHNVNVVQKSEEHLFRPQLVLHLAERIVLTEGKEQRHHRVPLLTPFALVHFVHDPLVIFPPILGQSTTQQLHKWEDLPPSLHSRQCRQRKTVDSGFTSLRACRAWAVHSTCSGGECALKRRASVLQSTCSPICQATRFLHGGKKLHQSHVFLSHFSEHISERQLCATRVPQIKHSRFLLGDVSSFVLSGTPTNAKFTFEPHHSAHWSSKERGKAKCECGADLDSFNSKFASLAVDGKFCTTRCAQSLHRSFQITAANTRSFGGAIHDAQKMASSSSENGRARVEVGRAVRARGLLGFMGWQMIAQRNPAVAEVVVESMSNENNLRKVFG